MTQAVRNLVHEFEALSDAERREALIELLRRAAGEPHESPDDGDLVVAADEVFQDLDRRERGS